MSKSFTLKGGDLVLENRSFDVVTGQGKLTQDLTLVFEEPIGTDPATPTFGSTLDGGVINGASIPTFIGQTFNPQIGTAISAEVRRVLQNYQLNQLQKMQAEGYQYQGRTTLDDSEIIYSINSVNVTNVGTVVLVQVNITTLAGVNVQFTFPTQSF